MSGVSTDSYPSTTAENRPDRGDRMVFTELAAWDRRVFSWVFSSWIWLVRSSVPE